MNWWTDPSLNSLSVFEVFVRFSPCSSPLNGEVCFIYKHFMTPHNIVPALYFIFCLYLEATQSRLTLRFPSVLSAVSVLNKHLGGVLGV